MSTEADLQPTPVARRYQFALVFPADEAMRPTAAQRVRLLLKRLKREAGVRVEWLPAQPRSGNEPTIAAVGPSTPQIARAAKGTPREHHARPKWKACHESRTSWLALHKRLRRQLKGLGRLLNAGREGQPELSQYLDGVAMELKKHQRVLKAGVSMNLPAIKEWTDKTTETMCRKLMEPWAKQYSQPTTLPLGASEYQTPSAWKRCEGPSELTEFSDTTRTPRRKVGKKRITTYHVRRHAKPDTDPCTQ